MNVSKLLILPLALGLALAACTRSEPEPAATPVTPVAVEPVASTPVEPVVPAAPTGLWFEPAALSACGNGQDVVTVNWDVSATPGVGSVQIVVLGPNEGMFAAAPSPKGSKETGPWMGAGKTMVVRNAADGTELARASVASIPCP